VHGRGVRDLLAVEGAQRWRNSPRRWECRAPRTGGRGAETVQGTDHPGTRGRRSPWRMASHGRVGGAPAGLAEIPTNNGKTGHGRSELGPQSGRRLSEPKLEEDHALGVSAENWVSRGGRKGASRGSWSRGVARPWRPCSCALGKGLPAAMPWRMGALGRKNVGWGKRQGEERLLVDLTKTPLVTIGHGGRHHPLAGCSCWRRERRPATGPWLAVAVVGWRSRWPGSGCKPEQTVACGRKENRCW
jgi:hypothetical protein